MARKIRIGPMIDPDIDKPILDRAMEIYGWDISSAIRSMIRFWDRLNPDGVIIVGGKDKNTGGSEPVEKEV